VPPFEGEVKMKNDRKNLEVSIKEFFDSVVDPVFEDIQTKLERLGKKGDIDRTQKDCMTIRVSSDDEDEFSYSIHIVDYRSKKDITKINAVPSVTKRIGNYEEKGHHIKPIDYPISDITKTDIINDFKKLFTMQLRKINFY